MARYCTPENTARGMRFSVGFSMDLIMAQSDKVYLVPDFGLRLPNNDCIKK